jgi:branched-chain amino acid transport system ATP-binding protein
MSPSGEPLLSIRGLTKDFGGLRALDAVDLEVWPAETVGIIGPNGAGKTTLFNCITGALRPTSGSVQLQGRQLVGLTPDVVCRLGICRTFQNVRPFSHLTAIENVMVPLANRPHGARRMRHLRAEAMEVLEALSIGPLAPIEAGHLNLFQRKQVELGRVLASGARIVLLDEVMAGLNPTESDRAVDLLRTLQKRYLFAIVAIEHIMRIIMAVSDRVIALDQGRVIAGGTPREVADHPRVRSAYLGDEIA